MAAASEVAPPPAPGGASITLGALLGALLGTLLCHLGVVIVVVVVLSLSLLLSSSSSHSAWRRPHRPPKHIVADRVVPAPSGGATADSLSKLDWGKENGGEGAPLQRLLPLPSNAPSLAGPLLTTRSSARPTTRRTTRPGRCRRRTRPCPRWQTPRAGSGCVDVDGDREKFDLLALLYLQFRPVLNFSIR